MTRNTGGTATSVAHAPAMPVAVRRSDVPTPAQRAETRTLTVRSLGGRLRRHVCIRLRRSPAVFAASLLAALALASSAGADPGSTSLNLLNDIVKGRDAAVVARFDPQMRGSLSANGLTSGWAAFQHLFGRYRGHGEPKLTDLVALIVVRVPLHMARQAGEFRIAFQTNGQIAGVYFLKAGVPLPP